MKCDLASERVKYVLVETTEMKGKRNMKKDEAETRNFRKDKANSDESSNSFIYREEFLESTAISQEIDRQHAIQFIAF